MRWNCFIHFNEGTEGHAGEMVTHIRKYSKASPVCPDWEQICLPQQPKKSGNFWGYFEKYHFM